MSKHGAPALLDFITKAVIDEIKKAFRDAGQFACAKIDRVIHELKAKGMKVPDMKGWSCDQKIGFVAALGPSGVACILAGTLTGALANDTSKEFARYSHQAEKTAQGIADRSGVSAAVNSAGSAATHALHKVGL